MVRGALKTLCAVLCLVAAQSWAAVNAKFYVDEAARNSTVSSSGGTTSIEVTAHAISPTAGDNQGWSTQNPPVGSLYMVVTNSALYSQITEGMVIQLTISVIPYAQAVTTGANVKMYVIRAARHSAVSASGGTTSIELTAEAIDAVANDNAGWTTQNPPTASLYMVLTNSTLFSQVTEGMVLQVAISVVPYSQLVQ